MGAAGKRKVTRLNRVMTVLKPDSNTAKDESLEMPLLDFS